MTAQMRTVPIISSAVLVFIAALTSLDAQPNDRLAWWREARFGKFIHWGLYSIPAGEWDGREVEGIGEWIMHRARIPVAEYERLAKKFNPIKFDAEEFARIAEDAGQKYMVTTAKHHDGFAMFRTQASNYNIVDATPFGRDSMKELAEACHRQHIRFGFYYSQTQDWHDPNGDGNTWDYDESKKDFATYFENLVKPQVRELLTQYGPIALIWFGTPNNITEKQSAELVDLVHTLQPACLVDGRIGHGKGDYHSMGDNEIPAKVLDYDWETPVTLNDTWGFKDNDHNWKSAQTLIRQLVEVVSKNGNYLLNVGPTAKGVIPKTSVERLHTVGDWLRVNGEAVYGAKASPYPYDFDWGAITSKPGKLYLIFFRWPKSEFVVYGSKSKVRSARLLSGGANLDVHQDFDPATGLHRVRIAVPFRAPDPRVSVIALDIDGYPMVICGACSSAAPQRQGRNPGRVPGQLPARGNNPVRFARILPHHVRQ